MLITETEVVRRRLKIRPDIFEKLAHSDLISVRGDNTAMRLSAIPVFLKLKKAL